MSTAESAGDLAAEDAERRRRRRSRHVATLVARCAGRAAALGGRQRRRAYAVQAGDDCVAQIYFPRRLAFIHSGGMLAAWVLLVELAIWNSEATGEVEDDGSGRAGAGAGAAGARATGGPPSRPR